jgi:hypothetical protein
MVNGHRCMYGGNEEKSKAATEAAACGGDSVGRLTAAGYGIRVKTAPGDFPSHHLLVCSNKLDICYLMSPTSLRSATGLIISLEDRRLWQ